ncbi:hypothetical protein [Tolumonas lignilytica]|jgi:hypothetical protein|uniref:hypothetical protein n=1 Tax=Tolumonas lignilytica TaxID=1283284 RepID=UPI000465E8E2|nr:hypothetical protein [Tolumonas lignilytica]
MSIKKLITTGLIVSLSAFAFINTAAAQMTPQQKAEWLKTHPRRAEVNARLTNQAHRINTERKEGDLTNPQAAKLHSADRHIRREERRMAAQHNGHLTKQEQIKLNQQENKVSQKIGQ